MNARKAAWKKASSVANFSPTTARIKQYGSTRTIVGGTTHTHPYQPSNDSDLGNTKHSNLKARIASISEAQKAKRSQDRDFFVSVLEASVTKRDAKNYLRTFTPTPKNHDDQVTRPAPHNSGPIMGPMADTIRVVAESPGLIQHSLWTEEPISTENPPHVALVKLMDSQSVDDKTLAGVAKTISQLKTLGMFSIIVVDCNNAAQHSTNWKETALKEATRIAAAIDQYDGSGARVVDSALAVNPTPEVSDSPFMSHNVFVESQEHIIAPMRLGELPIIPSFAFTTDTHMSKPINSTDVVLTLTRSLSGLQFIDPTVVGADMATETAQPIKNAFVDRIIILDPLGGIPAPHRPNGCHVFINLEQEFVSIRNALDDGSSDPRQCGINSLRKLSSEVSRRHIENLELAKSSLAMLPPTASAVITTPLDAANLTHSNENDVAITGIVGTRRKQNPLIHNLLTDKPVYSSSLPLGRIKGGSSVPTPRSPRPPLTTFAKKGMPLTILPNPLQTPWQPPAPDSRRLRLTDAYIDMPRLLHLIDDSFNRKLDMEHYLNRVNETMAGIIIAGEYEGGAILTWERPHGMTYAEAYESGRLVPYLDKFAVLKRSQGSGGVADIVFSAMVRDCFPEGVCWRSRKDNPVNKWYSERSKGTYKLPGVNWTMFWTTPNLGIDNQKFWDYENVCRAIEPSWADKKHIVD